MRCGEIMALEWGDINFPRRKLGVQRSDWKGHVTSTKGGRVRYVPLTVRLAEALQQHRHLRGVRVLCQDDNSPLTQKICRAMPDERHTPRNSQRTVCISYDIMPTAGLCRLLPGTNEIAVEIAHFQRPGSA